MKSLIIFALALATASTSNVVEEEGRITNGNTAKDGQFPYQVGMLLKSENHRLLFCGGSLIGHEWILTAAHCVDDVVSGRLYLGATKRNDAEVYYSITKENIIIHPDWDGKVADISLIHIPYVNYTARVQPIKLHPIADIYPNYAGNYGIATGWGRVSDRPAPLPSKLQWARFQIISNIKCSRTYGSTITYSYLCVSTTGGTSICKGDSGGPLVLESSNIQIGITSFNSRNGCQKGYPTVFTRVTSYLDWIKNVTGISY